MRVPAAAPTGDLADTFADLRWSGWQDEVAALRPDQGLSLFPPPFTAEGRDITAVSRWASWSTSTTKRPASWAEPAAWSQSGSRPAASERVTAHCCSCPVHRGKPPAANAPCR